MLARKQQHPQPTPTITATTTTRARNTQPTHLEADTQSEKQTDDSSVSPSSDISGDAKGKEGDDHDNGDGTGDTSLATPTSASASAYFLSLIKTELKHTSVFFVKDAKNYHVWSHRQWCIRHFYDNNTGIKSIPIASSSSCVTTDSLPRESEAKQECVRAVLRDELDYCRYLINDDVRNNSAWNQRYLILSLLLPLLPKTAAPSSQGTDSQSESAPSPSTTLLAQVGLAHTHTLDTWFLCLAPNTVLHGRQIVRSKPPFCFRELRCSVNKQTKQTK